MNIIYLHDLKVDCVIGVWQWERKIRQTLTIDLDMAWDIGRAAKSDQLKDTLNYKDVSKRVHEFVDQSSFNLVERLAEEVATILRNEFAIKWCRVKINKFGAVHEAGDVGVVIERGQAD